MKIIYLDQNKWIDLARAQKSPAEYPHQHIVLESLAQEANAGRITIPLSASNIYETHKISNKDRRDHLAWVQATLSQGLVFRGRHRRLEVEIVDLLRAAYSLAAIDRKREWFLSDLHFESVFENGDPRAPTISDKVLALIRKNPARSLFMYLSETPDDIRAQGVVKFSEGANDLRRRLEEHRALDLKQPLSMRRRIHSARLMINELDLILAIARKAGLPEENGSAMLEKHAKRIIEECPTYYIEREIVLRLDTQQRAIEENDLRDMQTFCAVVNYADIVVAENLFSNVAIQAGLHRKYGTKIITKLPDLAAALQE